MWEESKPYTPASKSSSYCVLYSREIIIFTVYLYKHMPARMYTL